MALGRRIAFATVVTALTLGASAGVGSAAPAGRLKPGRPPFVPLPALTPTGDVWAGTASAVEDAPGSALCQAYSNFGPGGTCDPSSHESSSTSYLTQAGVSTLTAPFQPAVVTGSTSGTALIHSALGECFPPTASTAALSAALLPPPGLVLYSGDARAEMSTLTSSSPLVSALRVEIDEMAHTYKVWMYGVPVDVRGTLADPPASSPCFGHADSSSFTFESSDGTSPIVASDPQPLPRDATRLVGSGSGTVQGIVGALPGQVTMAWKLVDATTPPPVAVDDLALVRAGQTRHLDVLANDTGTVRRPRQVTQPSCGQVLKFGKDIFFRAPRRGCPSGVTTFTYVATDGVRRSAPAVVTVVVTHPKHG
jgi:hypothetical protein